MPDEIEGLINRLERGRLRATDRHLACMASAVLSFKHGWLANVMVLDKPGSTRKDEAADRIYLTMADQFEPKQR